MEDGEGGKPLPSASEATAGQALALRRAPAGPRAAGKPRWLGPTNTHRSEAVRWLAAGTCMVFPPPGDSTDQPSPETPAQSSRPENVLAEPLLGGRPFHQKIKTESFFSLEKKKKKKQKFHY